MSLPRLTRLSNVHVCSIIIGLLCLLNVVRTENGLLPHFKVDHVAGKLNIDASRDSADISYNNDAVDLVVKPNNREAAKVVINSMKEVDAETSAARKSDADVALKSEAGQLRSITNDANGHSDKSSQSIKNDELDHSTSSTTRSIETNTDGLRHQKLHLQTSDQLGLKRSKIHKKAEKEDKEGDGSGEGEKVEQGEKRSNEGGSDVTWRGRINHADEKPDHVLSALNEIKNLMALSMKPPNLKAFDEMIPDTPEKYLRTADHVIKKLEHGQNKKRETEDNVYIHKVKGMLHPNLDNNSYSDDSDYGYVKKAHDVIEEDRQRNTQKPHSKHTKGCTGAHCRTEMYLTKADPGSENSFEDQFLGALNQKSEHSSGGHHPSSYHSTARHTSSRANNDYSTSDAADYEAAPLHKDHLQSMIEQTTSSPHTSSRIKASPSHLSSYHSNNGDNDEGYHHVPHNVEEEHGPFDEPHGESSSFHGNNNHHAPTTDDSYEKEFESKINDLANDDAVNTGSQHEHHTGHARHHQSYHEDDDDGDDSYHHDDGDHMGGYHGGHGYGEGNYHVPGAPDQHYDRIPSDWESNESSNEEPHTDNMDFHGDYDFNPTKEIKNKEHDLPGMEQENEKLTDWYSKNAIGENLNSTTSVMVEPPKATESSIIIQHAEDTKKEDKKEDKPKASNNTKEVESKFENAGEKPLGSKEAEKAIDKLNETLANSLNESTIKSISNYENNATSPTDLNKTSVAALNSFNTIKLEALNNDTVNAEKMLKDGDEGELKNASAAIQDDHNGGNKTDSSAETAVGILNAQEKLNSNATTSNDGIKGYNAEDLQKKIKNLQKKLNSTGDLLKKLNDLEKKLNASAERQIKEREKQQNTLKSTETDTSKLTDETFSKSNISVLGNVVAGLVAVQQKLTNATTNSTTTTTSGNGTAMENGGVENVYASIGEPGELDANATTAADNSTVKENSTNTDGKSGATATAITSATAITAAMAAVAAPPVTATVAGAAPTEAAAAPAAPAAPAPAPKSESVSVFPAGTLHGRSEEKHAEQKYPNIQKDLEEDNFIKDYINNGQNWTKRQKTVPDISSSARVGLKRHKTKVYKKKIRRLEEKIRRKTSHRSHIHKEILDKQSRRQKVGLRRHKHKRRSRNTRKKHKKSVNKLRH